MQGLQRKVEIIAVIIFFKEGRNMYGCRWKFVSITLKFLFVRERERKTERKHTS